MGKGKLIYISLILLMLSGCKNSVSDILDDTPINKDGSIAFRTGSLEVKGTAQDDLTAYDEVNLIAYSHTGIYANGKELYRKMVLDKDAATVPVKWDYSPRMFWPEGRTLSFLAYGIESKLKYAAASGGDGVFISGNASNGAPTIEYVVPKDVTSQPDLLVTAQLDHKQVNNVMLNMKHALSCVSFCATGLPGMRVKSITLSNVYRRATLALDDADIQWVPDPNSKGLTALEPGIDSDIPLEDKPTDGNYLMTADGYLMMIPQTLTDAAIDVLYYKESDKTETKITYLLPTTIAWEPGKKYIYKFGEDLEEVVVYYEKYTDGSYGFQSKKTDLSPLDATEAKIIAEAGYGVLSRSRLVSKDPKIRLGSGTEITTTKTDMPSVSGGYNLYAVNQTGKAGISTFTLPPTPEPVAVYFDGNSIPCGKIIPHFAKGVNDWNPTDYAIRTPQQMRNISALTTASLNLNATDNPSYFKTLKQERNLDFSLATIGGGTLNGAVVDDVFAGTYISDPSKSISKVTISAANMNKIGLFSVNNGPITDVTLKASSITGNMMVGGIVGENYWGGHVIRARVMGINNTTAGVVNITGVTQVGGAVGINRGTITGSSDVDPATEVTVAEVSGWVNVIGSGSQIGGIAGYNAFGSINMVLVYGVFVTGPNAGDLLHSKITIKGGDFVGGIAGQNDVIINGNIIGTGKTTKNMPDVAGIVEIQGRNWVGGITGINATTGRLNSVNVRLGRAPAMIINGTGDNVGGIAGENMGTLGVDSDNTFISTRGNIRISGANNVGGIVGKNTSTAEMKNCFVYNFHNEGTYAPEIISTVSNAGGIAGSNAASVTNCSVFSANSAVQLSVTSAISNAGGIVGSNSSGAITSACSLVGNIDITVAGRPLQINQGAGGIFGDNKTGTQITNCWIGSSDGNGIIANAQSKLGLVISAPGVTPSFGVPFITADNYVGGIVGLNDGGVIDGITLSDNVIIGRKDVQVNDGSNWVGGIVGGNTASFDGVYQSVIKNCSVKNVTGKSVVIQGATNLGGIAGLNNGVIDRCVVSGTADNRFKISALGKIGAIVGQLGGHRDLNLGVPQSGNDHTIIRNCAVSGYVTIEGNPGGWGLATEVGGIVGLTGPNKNNINTVDNCRVGDVNSSSIIISVYGTVGGIVGKNQGNINSCDVRNTTITSYGYYAGGITGQSSAVDANFIIPDKYRSNINDCRVYSGVAITGPVGVVDNRPVTPAALVGYLDALGAYIFGGTTQNQVNQTGVTVNAVQPTLNNLIMGFATNGATIRHAVTIVPDR